MIKMLKLIIFILFLPTFALAEDGFFNFLRNLNQNQIHHQKEGRTSIGNINYQYLKNMNVNGETIGYEFQCYQQKFFIDFFGTMMSVHKNNSREGLFVDMASNRYKSIENYLSDQLYIDAVEPTMEPSGRSETTKFYVDLVGTSNQLDKVNLLTPQKNIGNTPLAINEKGEIHTLLKERGMLAAWKVVANYIPYLSWLLSQSLNQKGEDRQISIGRAMYWMDIVMNSHEELKSLNINLFDDKISPEDKARSTYFFASILKASGLYDKNIDEIRLELDKSAVNYPQLGFLNRNLDKVKLYSEIGRHLKETDLKGEEWTEEKMMDYFKGSGFETLRSRAANYSMFVIWFLSSYLDPIYRNLTDLDDYRTRGVILGYTLEHYYNEKEEVKYNFMKQAIHMGRMRVENYQQMQNRVEKVIKSVPSLICASYEKIIFGDKLSKEIRQARTAINKGIGPLESADFLMFKNRNAIEHIAQGEYFINQGNYSKALKKLKKAHNELGKSAKKILKAQELLGNIDDEQELYLFNLNRERQKLIDLIKEWKILALKLNDGVKKILTQQIILDEEMDEGYFLYTLYHSKGDKRDKFYHDFMELYHHPINAF